MTLSITSLFHRSRRQLTRTTAFVSVFVLTALPAHASGSSMPWEEPLEKILESIEGPVAKIVAVIIIIATGLALAFGDTSGGFRRLIQIVFG
ncbi:TrbC/VirB2 family protein, partial [Sinorhizobium saheli]